MLSDRLRCLLFNNKKLTIRLASNLFSSQETFRRSAEGETRYNGLSYSQRQPNPGLSGRAQILSIKFLPSNRYRVFPDFDPESVINSLYDTQCASYPMPLEQFNQRIISVLKDHFP